MGDLAGRESRDGRESPGKGRRAKQPELGAYCGNKYLHRDLRD